MAFVSAGAYARELDLSLYAETLTNTIAALAHTFNKGPIGTRTLVSNIDNLVSLFGEPIDPSVSAAACQGWFAAREYLRKGNKLYVTRVESAATPAAYAAMSVRGVSDDQIGVQAADGVTSIPATRTLTSATGDFITDGVKVGMVLEISGGSADDGFYVIVDVQATVLTVDRNWPTGSLSTLTFDIWCSKREAGVNGVTSVAGTRTFTSSGATFEENGVVAGDVLQISGGTDDDGLYLISTVDSETQVTVNRDWQSGELTSLTYTVYSKLTTSNTALETGADGATNASNGFSSAGSTFVTNGVRAGDWLVVNDSGTAGDNGIYTISSVDSETAITISENFPTGSLSSLDFTVYAVNRQGSTATDGEFADTGADFQAQGVQAGDILYINDPVNDGDNGYYLITGLKTGSEDTTLEVNESAWPAGSLTGLSYKVLPGSITFQGATKGTAFTDLQIRPLLNSSDDTKIDLETRNSAGTFQLEKVFSFDRTDADTIMSANSAYWTATVRSNRTGVVTGDVFDASGGDDGYTGIVDSDYIGNSASGTGLRSFVNAELIDINLLMCPGVSSQNVQDELIRICETRGDCFALVDPPDWSTVDSVQDILDFTNGTLIRTTALNTSYAALYWTWQQVYDEYHSVNVWTAPSGHVAAVYANNDNLQAPWYAPAGFKRGKVSGSVDVRYSPDQDDRDALQGSTARVNPIVNFTGAGIYVFGQKTLLAALTALNRVHTRRMLLYCEKVIATAARQLVFDPNDVVLEREFKQLVEPVLDNVLSRRGIHEYLIQAATTDTDRDNQRAVFKIFIKPTPTAEVIEIFFAVTSQGANFQELLAA